jgi:hypothetical protein
VLGFAAGGALGAMLGASDLGVRVRRLRGVASVAGLVLGIVLCGAVLPVYLDSAMDDVTDAAAEGAAGRIGTVLDRPSSAWDQAGDAAGELARAGAARLPALALLGWTLLGPALAAGLEARRPRGATGVVTRPAEGSAGR